MGAAVGVAQQGGSIEELRRAVFLPTEVCAAMLRLQFKTPGGATLTKFVYIW